MELIAKTFLGLEEVLADEIRAIGGEDVEVLNRAVRFYGTQETMYRANFQLRTALRILKPIFSFKARNEDEWYGNARKFEWTSIMELSQRFAVDSVVNSDVFTHSRYVALKLKDAIVDQFRDKYGRRPFVDPVKPQIRIHIHVSNDECTISLDSSGESLHRRGYRIGQEIAPINEVLAAGLIKLSGWDEKTPLIDPMCGSGTILIEAALMANGTPPGVFRKEFGFENWPDFDSDLMQTIYNDDSMEHESEASILGLDISRSAVEIAFDNLKNAGLHNMVDLKVMSFFDYVPPVSDNAFVITNPPYGERLKKEQIDKFYKEMSDRFKQHYSGYDVWLISSNFEALKSFGLRPSATTSLNNGGLDCKFMHYEMYRGSKKTKYNDPEI